MIDESKNVQTTPTKGWSGGAMVLGKLPVPGRPTIWILVGQGPIALAVDAGGGCLDIFTLICPFSPLTPSLWEKGVVGMVLDKFRFGQHCRLQNLRCSTLDRLSASCSIFIA